MTLDAPSLGYEIIWNEQEHGWELVSTGAAVATDVVHNEIRAHALLSSTAFNGITVNLFESAMSVAQWQLAMLDEIINGHTANAIFGAGGIGNMTPEAWVRLETTVAKEAGFLSEFAQSISDGTVSPLQARARAKQYAQAMEQSYWNEWRAGIGEIPEISHLPLLSQSPGDGNTVCFGNCQCTLLFNADGSVEWNLNVADHEADCLALAAGGPFRTS